jgi:hypothetical protein
LSDAGRAEEDVVLSRCRISARGQTEDGLVVELSLTPKCHLRATRLELMC